MHLVQIFMQGGVMMYLLLLITLVLFGIVLRTLWHLFVRGGNDSFVIQNCLDGLLFWGGFAVIIGGPRPGPPTLRLDRLGRGTGLLHRRTAGPRRRGNVLVPAAMDLLKGPPRRTLRKSQRISRPSLDKLKG
jgi:hypothetical protein